MTGDLTRRQLLGSGAFVGLAALGIGGNHLFRSARAVPPSVPHDQLTDDGWVKDYQPPDQPEQSSGSGGSGGSGSGTGGGSGGEDEDEGPVLTENRSVGPVDASIKGYTVEYRDADLVNTVDNTQITINFQGQTEYERLGAHAGDAYGDRLAVFAATRIDISPHLEDLPGNPGAAEILDQVEDQAKDQYEQQLEDAGLEDIEQVASDELDADLPDDARTFTYDATYPVNGTTVTYYGETIQIEGFSLAVAGYLAMWHDGDSVLVAAGAHPDENYSDTITKVVQGAQAEASFTLALDPEEKREEVLGYMSQVS